ncbi:MAG: ankyrin repeat domain-containing protein [Zoogloeaceae bacterium]|nr:ankyrin repeat domain-containing protein [Zoogloeaceae bacterium]
MSAPPFLKFFLFAALAFLAANRAVAEKFSTSDAAAVSVASHQRTDFTPPSPAQFGVSIETGDIAQAKKWLERGLHPDFMASRIGSGMMIGAWEGNVPMMEIFYQYGANIHLENDAGEQALLLAVWQGKKPAVEWLLAHGATLNRPPGKWSALHYAAFSGRRDLLNDLLKRGANPDARSPNGSTPLMMAIYNNQPGIAQTLIERGANRNLRNDWGDGALEWAMRYNQTNIARQLGSEEDFAVAASLPKSAWGNGARARPLPPDLDKLLRDRAYLIARGLSPENIDRNIAALRARYARESNVDSPPRVHMLQITADPDTPDRQRAEIVSRPATSSPAPYRLPRQKPHKIPARHP